MNYYAARQLEDGPSKGKWHYTCENRRLGVWPVAGCSPWDLCPEGHGLAPSAEQAACETCDGRGLVEKADPCPGHDTAEEACEHAREHALDNARFDHGVYQAALHECEVPDCRVFSNAYAEPGHPVGPRNITLCPDHMNREGLERVIPRGSVGQITSSY